MAKDSKIKNMPTFKDFCDDVKEIYAEGDLARAYDTLEWHIANMDEAANDIVYGGKPLTWPFIKDKFSNHITQWNLMYGKKVGTNWFSDKMAKERKNIHEFLNETWYAREFATNRGSPERDRYIFGGVPIKELRNQLNEFKKLWTGERRE